MEPALGGREEVGVSGAAGEDELGGERTDARDLGQFSERLVGVERAEPDSGEAAIERGVGNRPQAVDLDRRQPGQWSVSQLSRGRKPSSA